MKNASFKKFEIALRYLVEKVGKMREIYMEMSSAT